MSAEASTRCGAEYGERTDERVNSRSGGGTLGLARSSWPSRNSVRAPIFRSGCRVTVAVRNKRW